MARDSTSTTRREPSQQRSRERVELILRATEAVISKHGVSGLTTTAIASEASIPASAIYQYFDNSDDVLRAYVGKEFERIAFTIAESVMALELVSFRTLFGAVAWAHAEYFEGHPGTIALWIEGRVNPVVAETVSGHSVRLGRFMDSAVRRADLVKPETPAWACEAAVRTFDRIFEMTFSSERNKHERDEIVTTYLDVLTTYAEANYVNERGADGIPSSEFIAALGGKKAVEPTDFWSGSSNNGA